MNHSARYSEDALPSTPRYTFKNLIFYFLFTLKQGYTYKKDCFQPVPSLLNNPPNPRAVLVTFIVPLCFRVLDNPQLLLFLEEQQHSTNEFHFRILVLLLFLALFLSSCFVQKILTMRSFDMLQNFSGSFRELLERVQLHNVPVKQSCEESFKFTFTNIS